MKITRTNEEACTYTPKPGDAFVWKNTQAAYSKEVFLCVVESDCVGINSKGYTTSGVFAVDCRGRVVTFTFRETLFKKVEATIESNRL
jgi:hypothetical protein